MKLYHGSDVVVEYPLLSKSKTQHDFGQAFYLTSSYNQATQWAKHRVKRNNFHGKPTVSIFEFSKQNFINMKVLKFEKPDPDWLEYIIKNRRNKSFSKYKDYDLVIGPVVDGSFSWYTIVDYLNHKIDFEETIKELKPFNLKDQWAFKTEKSLQFLQYRGVKYEKLSRKTCRFY